jgi:hypothetical protein
MRTESDRAKIRWLAAGGVGVAVMAALLILFRTPLTPAGAPGATSSAGATRPPPVEIAKLTTSGAILAEETALRDLRPLFLPTPLNVALREPRREAARTFLDKETLQLGFAEGDLSIANVLPPIATVGGKPAAEANAVDILGEGAQPAMVGFGRSPTTVTPMPGRGGFLEVVASATGQVVLAEPLPVEARPAGDKPWEPLELMAVIDPAGLAAPLLVTTSSRLDEVDLHFRNYLARRYRLGDRLPPGFYHVVVGP